MLGIVIANWNGEKLIDKCIGSLVKQSYQDFKIYIIDNDSKDNSVELINGYKDKADIKLTKLDYNSGFAVANNIGIKQAIDDGCRYILTLNNDIEVPEDCLKNAVSEVEKEGAAVYQLFMINYFERNKCDAAGLKFTRTLIPVQIGYDSTVESALKSDEEIEGACAGAAIYSAEALEAVKLPTGDYFDSNFFAYYEDVDLALRLRNAGYKAKLLKESIVYHMHSATGGKINGFKEYYLIRNLFIYTKRNQTEEAYKKNKLSYYRIFVNKFIKSLRSMEAMKLTVKGLKDGLKENKKINSIDG